MIGDSPVAKMSLDLFLMLPQGNLMLSESGNVGKDDFLSMAGSVSNSSSMSNMGGWLNVHGPVSLVVLAVSGLVAVDNS